MIRGDITMTLTRVSVQFDGSIRPDLFVSSEITRTLLDSFELA